MNGNWKEAGRGDSKDQVPSWSLFAMNSGGGQSEGSLRLCLADNPTNRSTDHGWPQLQKGQREETQCGDVK
jgi:hypothetical protein